VQDAEENTKTTIAQEVSKRPFGKTGEQIPILGIGGVDYLRNHLLLRQAIRMGVTYWDTAELYGQGASEEGIGTYFEKYPEDREKVFLVTKTTTREGPEAMTKALEGSLARLKTSYVDLYFLHNASDANKSLNLEVKQWAEKAKAEGKIRYFGFSAHANVEECLEFAAKQDWIDGIMMTYNYQTMGTDRVEAAVEACARAGIGMIAMKTMAKMSSFEGDAPPEIPPPRETEEERRLHDTAISQMAKMAQEFKANAPEFAERLTERFVNKGFTMEQAKLKIVLENPHIASACTIMPNMTILLQNVAAATGQVQLTRKDKDLLNRYAALTAHQYCPGCTRHCESGAERELPIGVVMRCLMYARDYGDRDKGKSIYRALPSEIRRTIDHTDFAAAEKRCPRRLPIGKLMHEAAIELA
jgi:aryl-alcohol dehydrogenase-like predicted oxidoreductase